MMTPDESFGVGTVTVIAVALADVIAGQENKMLLAVRVQTGVFVNVELKVTTQLPGSPVPSVKIQAVSDPTIVGVPVPQLDGTGAVPELPIWRSIRTRVAPERRRSPELEEIFG